MRCKEEFNHLVVKVGGVLGAVGYADLASTCIFNMSAKVFGGAAALTPVGVTVCVALAVGAGILAGAMGYYGGRAVFERVQGVRTYSLYTPR